ncbi:Amphoterin-induced protein 1 AMIGO-1 [Collichthys lucidus]|uniref:Amphoterin-induced protein 1 AMIGO-1 n=1 Tax=Collichthys lucidus TaxID=240159 RepID=A0A4U5UCN9_COLLU|nr:Amphoterin-induced protein 1 AMIGO-1 [Collichthys lucidus]
MLPEIKGKVMNVALETLEEEGLYIAADSQTEGVGTTTYKMIFRFQSQSSRVCSSIFHPFHIFNTAEAQEVYVSINHMHIDPTHTMLHARHVLRCCSCSSHTQRVFALSFTGAIRRTRRRRKSFIITDSIALNELLHDSIELIQTTAAVYNPDMMGGSLWISHHAARAGFTRRSFITVLPLALLLPTVRVSTQSIARPLDCHKTCVCASNIISCSKMNLTNVPTTLPKYTAVLDLSYNFITRLRAEWTPYRLSKLHSLLLSHNSLTFLSSEAFVHVTKVRYLDLSSNGLRLLDENIFQPLEHLEVLLLYNNRISQIDRSAFSDLSNLQKLYLSQNQISRIPLELVKERSRLETLRLLDVSSNRIKVLPIQELQALPGWIKNGLYFHNNPVPCSCQLYDLVARWQLKELSSATDFKLSHTCVVPGPQKDKVPILDLDKVFLNCSEVSIMDEYTYLEQFLVLDCDTRQKDMVKTWTLPGDIPLPPASETAVMRGDGSLQIGPLKAKDSGVYTCYATSDSFNETLYVTVVVFNSTNSGGLENLKTAYTTLVACVITVVMVFMYLYLTPCRCACCPGQGLEKNDPGDSLRSSTVSISHDETGQDGAEGGGGGFPYRHVAFLEPKDQPEQNGRLNPIGEEDEEWQGDDTERRRSDAESVSSVCSDTPMVV